MKVSCLTFHDSSNYGSVLQSYALQTVICGMSHEYEIINYANAEKHKFDSIFRKNKESSWKNHLIKLAEFPYRIYKKQKFVRFSNKYLHCTPRFYTMDELTAYASTRDAISVGSDQVWNEAMVRRDPAYFLKFTEARKRMAYAASLGISKVNANQQEFYYKMLSDFEHIAVRESSGASLLEEILGRPVQVVLDPTLLLSKPEWAKICPPPRKKPYIFAYILRNDPQVQSFLNRLHKQTGLPVRYVSRGYISAWREGAVAVPSPTEWVRDLMHAEYVVTTSFHGTAFSVNFQKTFFTFIEGDISHDTNSRQVDLLKACGLLDRLNQKERDKISLEKPDFTKSIAFLKMGRQQAHEYIEKTLAQIAGDE